MLLCFLLTLSSLLIRWLNTTGDLRVDGSSVGELSSSVASRVGSGDGHVALVVSVTKDAVSQMAVTTDAEWDRESQPLFVTLSHSVHLSACRLPADSCGWVAEVSALSEKSSPFSSRMIFHVNSSLDSPRPGLFLFADSSVDYTSSDDISSVLMGFDGQIGLNLGISFLGNMSIDTAEEYMNMAMSIGDHKNFTMRG